MNKHDPLKDLTAYLDPVTYVDDQGEIRTAYLQKDMPGLLVNDQSDIKRLLADNSDHPKASDKPL